MTPPSEEYCLIPLTQGQFAKVDTADYKWLMQWNWHAYWSPDSKSFYAAAWVNKYHIKMHREIMGLHYRDGKQVDHINGDSLDNRRSNLRIATHSQNQMNRKLQSNSVSGHRGVSFCKQTGLWKARFVINQKEVWIGRFATIEEAVAAVKNAHISAYGEFHRT